MPELASNRPADADFDFTAGVFLAQDSRPAGLGSLDLATLSPVQRALLVIDGTVTRFLAAYLHEPVVVTPLVQDTSTAGVDGRWLDCDADGEVLRRTSILTGQRSGQLFVWADSVIVPERLAADMHRGLSAEPFGLGQVLRNSGLETRRDCLWFGRDEPANRPAQVNAAGARVFLSRTYRIVAGGKTLMLITERFPLKL